MGLSNVGICNLALLHVGVRKFITSLTEPSVEAEVCNLVFEHARDQVLEQFDWRFARKRAALALLSGEDRSEWSYVYALPGDCIKARWIASGVSNPSRKDSIPFDVEAKTDLSSRVLVTNQSGATLVYTARVEDPNVFSPLFAEAVAWHLAAELALAIPNKANLENQCRIRFTIALDKAKVSALAEQKPFERPDSEFIAERG